MLFSWTHLLNQKITHTHLWWVNKKVKTNNSSNLFCFLYFGIRLGGCCCIFWKSCALRVCLVSENISFFHKAAICFHFFFLLFPKIFKGNVTTFFSQFLIEIFENRKKGKHETTILYSTEHFPKPNMPLVIFYRMVVCWNFFPWNSI